MDMLAMQEKCDDVVVENPLNWLMEEPKEVTSLWQPSELKANEELL
ncbi:hypothetical protein SO574_08210 [Vibrio alfacsensis]|nr:hypothetical protein [Vibrio alfacsensis]WQE75210.1 hypothetical protein SO574_08210 [Vibrio alfacsensis]